MSSTSRNVFHFYSSTGTATYLPTYTESLLYGNAFGTFAGIYTDTVIQHSTPVNSSGTDPESTIYQDSTQIGHDQNDGKYQQAGYLSGTNHQHLAG